MGIDALKPPKLGTGLADPFKASAPSGSPFGDAFGGPPAPGAAPLGIGSTIAPPPALGGGGQAGMAAAAQNAFRDRWGQATAPQAMETRDAGNFFGPGTSDPLAVGSAGVGAPGVKDPAAAGTAEATMPGSSGGSPEPGIPAAEAGFQAPQQPSGANAPQPQAVTKPMPPAGPAPQPPAPMPEMPKAAPPAPAPVVQQAQAMQASAGQTAGTQQQAAAAPPGTAAAGQTATTQTTADTPPPAGTAPAEGGTVRGYGGVEYTLKPGVKWPRGFVNWNEKQRQAWLTANAAPTNPVQAEADKLLAAAGFSNKLVLPVKATVPTDPALSTVYPGMADADLYKATGGDDALGKLVMDWQRRYMEAHAPQQADETAMTQTERNARLAAQKQLAAIESVLKLYGVTTAGDKPAPPAGGGNGGNGGGNGGSTGDPDGTDSPTPPVEPDEGQSIPGDPPAGGVIGQPTTEFQGTNLDLPTQTKSFDEYLNFYKKGGWGDKAPLMAEMAVAADRQQMMDNARQQSVNLFGGAAQDFQNSGLYTGIQQSALDMMKQGDPTDWEGIKNRATADEANVSEQTRRALADQAGRRGVSAGAASGMATQLNSASKMGLVRHLGELDVKKAASGRAYQRDALNSAMGASAATQGVNLSNIGHLAAQIMGNASDYGNPASGAASAIANVDAMQAEIDAANQAGKFTIGDAAKLAVGVGLMFVPGGQVAGAAVLAGSAKDAAGKGG